MEIMSRPHTLTWNRGVIYGWTLTQELNPTELVGWDKVRMSWHHPTWLLILSHSELRGMKTWDFTNAHTHTRAHHHILNHTRTRTQTHTHAHTHAATLRCTTGGSWWLLLRISNKTANDCLIDPRIRCGALNKLPLLLISHPPVVPALISAPVRWS